jgi:Ti-type conjugative transfer relaxase TraA
LAVYRFQSKVISRSKGQSAIACAAYRAGEKLHDERLGEVYDFTRKSDVAHTEILLPEHAPAWMANRQTLWNAVEGGEKRKDSQLARELQLTLPRELTTPQHIQLTREFIQNRFVAAGMVADIAIHVPKASDGELQPHAHVLLTMREIKENGFGLKVRTWNEKCELEMWRAEWCDYQNKHLALNGHDIRVDHRSLKEQGIDLIPQKKIGPTGSFHRMAAYEEHINNTRINGDRLLADPDMVLEILTRQQSTFTHRDIARVVNRYTADGEQFLAVYEKVKVSDVLVQIGKDDKGQERFTTKDMVKLESEMMTNAHSLIEKNEHAIHEVSLEKIAEKHELSNEQNTAFGYLTDKGDLKNVVGYAGTGKSRLLGAAREAWEMSGYRVLGATLSGIAAENLENSSGIESRTLASRLLAWEKGRDLLASNDILVIDEAGMLGTRQLAEVTEEANKRGAKLILVGDPQEQLQAIEAGAAFRGIVQQTSSKVELKEIWRQHEPWQKEATVLFSTRKTPEAIAKYAEHNCVHEYATQAQAKTALIEAWNDVRISQPDKTQVMLAFTRDDVQGLNESARSLRQSLGELETDHIIQTERGDKPFAEGDKIYFLKNDRELGVKNGTLGTILNIENGSLTVQISKDDKEPSKMIQFSTDRYNYFDYGYASTIHKGQGGTFDRSFVLASKYLDRHATNVGMTRHRDGVELFWSKEEFPIYDDMTKSLSRDRSKDLAHDYVGHEFEKASFAMHRGLDTLWDNFWEKYGKEWLDKIQQTIVGLVDGAKEIIEIIKEQAAKTLNTKEPQTDNKISDDAWLNKMRAIRDEAYKNNPKLEKELRSGRYGYSAIQDTEINSNLTSRSTFDKPITEEQRVHYEERYQKIMKDAEIRETKAEADRLTKQSDKSAQKEKSLQKLDKEIEIDF